MSNPYRNLLYSMVGVKDRKWSYQEEMRIIFPEGGTEYDIPFEISAIIFGADVSNKLVEDIKEILNDSVVTSV